MSGLLQVLEPINDLIPEPFKEVIDIQDEFESVLEGIVGGSIDTGKEQCGNFLYTHNVQ